ncbi:MAG: hypothetical protein Q8Q12_12085, partial [bacterium]|nr:hypothetical protein [bacterium]
LGARRSQDSRRDGSGTKEWMASFSVCTVEVHRLDVAARGRSPEIRTGRSASHERPFWACNRGE